jgi:hypothetical protein
VTDIAKEYPDDVARIVCDEGNIGCGHLGRFMELGTLVPTIVTTSQLLTTGVDVQTCKNVVLARVINSMTEFKQIIGRGTRVRDDPGNGDSVGEGLDCLCMAALILESLTKRLRILGGAACAVPGAGARICRLPQRCTAAHQKKAVCYRRIGVREISLETWANRAYHDELLSDQGIHTLRRGKRAFYRLYT